MSNRVYLGLTTLFLTMALVVFAVKIGKAKVCPDLCLHADGLALNRSFFSKELLDQHPRLRQYPIHLIVFLDLKHDCIAYLYEYEQWVRPLSRYPFYGLTFFMPSHNSPDTIRDFMRTAGLVEEQVQRFNPKDRVAALHRYGLLKILFTQEKQVEWMEPGNELVGDQEAFGARLEKRIREIETQMGKSS